MNKIKELQKEEEKIYKKIKSIIDKLPIKKQVEFYKAQQKYIDNQIELEKFCGR